jgi:hypothetical protein
MFKHRLAAWVLLALLPLAAAAAEAPNWSQLSPDQQQILGALQFDFNSLPPRRRAALVLNADRVLQMPAEQRERVIANLQQWQALSPKQRQRALLQRERLRELPPQMRKHIKQRFDELKRQPGGVEAACPGPPEARLACLAEQPLPVSPARQRPPR